MPQIAHSGRARISIRRPRALGECDVCASWWNLDDLSRQFQWGGNSLVDTGYLVCRDCLDVPQAQFRTPILPPDPIPRINPRPSPNITGIPYVGGPLPTSPDNQGFTQYVLAPSFPIGGYPPTSASVLASVAALSGVPTPAVAELASYIVPMGGDVTVPLVPANAQRTWLLIFNPTQFVAQISTGTATQGAITNLSIGPQEAYFWATQQGLAPAYIGALTAIGLYAPLPLWAWEDNANLLNLINDGGVLALSSAALGYPTSPVGLPAGSVWNDGLTIAVVPGLTPDPAAPPIIFGSITAQALLALGGGNLPLGDPDVFGQLWNNGGLICVSFGPNLQMTNQFGQPMTDQNGNPLYIR